jgi:NTP pyrophosphatase (non-canonical NTP hydrolase)
LIDTGLSEKREIRMNEWAEIKKALRRFAEERGWGQFHSPKNLATALAVEAGELLEHFQWMNEAQSDELATEKRIEVAEEIADVQIYLLQLADRLGIDLEDAVRSKITKNALRYPIESSHGHANKPKG